MTNCVSGTTQGREWETRNVSEESTKKVSCNRCAAAHLRAASSFQVCQEILKEIVYLHVIVRKSNILSCLIRIR